jgi:hypothetical protein
MCPREYHHIVLSKDALASEFAEIYTRGLIRDYSDIYSVYFGAHFHSPADKGHWLEVVASIYKKGMTVDEEAGLEFQHTLGRSND